MPGAGGGGGPLANATGLADFCRKISDSAPICAHRPGCVDPDFSSAHSRSYSALERRLLAALTLPLTAECLAPYPFERSRVEFSPAVGATKNPSAKLSRPKVCERSHSHALVRTTYISAPSRAEAETLRAGVAGGVSVHLELRPSLSAAALLKESMHG